MTALLNSEPFDEPLVPAQLCPVDSSPSPAQLEEAADLPVLAAPQPDHEAWRVEVAARLARYRTRRKPRSPRYPSLMLPFDSPENWSRSARPASPDLAPGPYSTLDPGPSSIELSPTAFAGDPQPQFALGDAAPELSTNVIEFPRSAAIPVFESGGLADPIFDRPRILEAPEVVPPPPALGGILIDSPQPQPADRALADPAPAAASVPRRLLATAVDAVIVAAALASFAAIFLRFNPVRGPIPLLAATAAVLAVVFWMAYQFAFIVFTGSTPGLRAARLAITRFDGLAVTRRLRQWRVLASFLSFFAAGLGYLWCFLDQDSLCWHDRITRTHLQPAQPAD